MNKDTRNAVERATQRARALLEEDFAAQLEGDFDIHRGGALAVKPGSHLTPGQALQRERIVAAIEHKRAAGMNPPEAVADYRRDAAFTSLNRCVALKMLEARELVQECITRGERSPGYREFCGLAPGLALLPDNAGYRLYIESLFDELSTEVKVLFDRRDPSSVLWPKRTTLEQVIEVLNADELAGVWGEDETIGWFYQFFNGQDERRKMREESQAPRNSRELAVRNQFFTPRYVVQFLTDNTLGRIWYEMRGTKTALAQCCEYMVRRPDEQFVARAKRDPRDLRVLDPACGSGHFLLYALDLLLAIYQEAHADPESPTYGPTGQRLADDYPSLEALRRALPGLILSHNLHGVDIDPRCAQIAQLALWMRAQRAFREFGISRADRPLIRRSNIIIAEPLVADDQLANEFVARLRDAELGRVFRTLVDALNLAADMGLLLRLESFVGRSSDRGQGRDLFTPPEELIRVALARFVAEDGQRTSMRRRLFADDAAQGIGLLAITEMNFDVVLMNPPFGVGSLKVKKDFERAYPRTKNDIYAAFVERGIELLRSHGRLGAITSRTGFFLSSFEKWRTEVLLKEAIPVVCADIGLGVMDAAMVEAAAYCLEKHGDARYPTVFIRVLEEQNDKNEALIRELKQPWDEQSKSRFVVDPSTFASVPRSPFAYWVSDSLRRLFSTLPQLESEGRVVCSGPDTGQDFRCIRAWWETSETATSIERWRPHAKGGPYSPFYADVQLLLVWGKDGHELTAIPTANIRNAARYFRPALTWSLRTKRDLSMRPMPRHCIFGHKGPAILVDQDDPQQLLALLAITNSMAFRALVEFQLAAADARRGGAARSYEVGVLQRTPVPRLDTEVQNRLARLAERASELKRELDSAHETSHAFLLPQGLSERITGFDYAATTKELAQITRQIDDLAFTLYGLGSADRESIEASGEQFLQPNITDADEEAPDDDDDPGEGAADTAAIDTLISWLVGVVFGRFDLRLATRERQIPPPPLSPFEPLPTRPPGMWPQTETRIVAPPDILVDDPGHSDDIVRRVAITAAALHWREPEDLRQRLAREIFPLQIKMYSKSRRKAPIYWQLATSSASYSVWLYIHGFTNDTLFRVQNDYVAPKLAHEERRLEAMTRELRQKPTAAQRSELARQESFVDELRVLLEEVKRVAPLWSSNLNDGVIINFAPLWRLVPQHKPWQKELKSIWNALCEGKYDWTHLAMHLWPERVVPKCAIDRSVAIAHELEEVFWVAYGDGKWIPRKAPARPVEELVRERTSPAVKSALKNLLEAPTVTGNGGRGRSRHRGSPAMVEGAL